MNSKQSPSRCLLFLSLKPAATTSRSIHEKTSQNDTVPTNLNDIVALHQLVHLSLAKQPKAGTRSSKRHRKGYVSIATTYWFSSRNALLTTNPRCWFHMQHSKRSVST
ncbi:heat stress transcription factor A-5 [Dorcoceras hygrometricum]|uniref:Heat stress transcription factor A-5 n=1 Tax=Dorcoceras hygrometricum TaxID=472368 RepID=A0A2Z7D2R9_9LAMI|nr:heat stress transcription factor A-5 [Dorcoceras hygrometricum]